MQAMDGALEGGNELLAEAREGVLEASVVREIFLELYEDFWASYADARRCQAMLVRHEGLGLVPEMSEKAFDDRTSRFSALAAKFRPYS
jgi:hypothetical protein